MKVKNQYLKILEYFLRSTKKWFAKQKSSSSLKYVNLCTQYLVGAPLASVRCGMEAISLWHCWGTIYWAFSSSGCWIHCFSSFSWKYPIDSIWGSAFRFRRCCVQSTLKDGSAQFVFLYTILRIFTFSFYTINVCTIYLWQKNTFGHWDTAALTCFWTLYPRRIQRGHWRFFGTPRLTKATRIIPEGERNTADDVLESVTDWETKLTAPLSPVFCSQMSNPWK